MLYQGLESLLLNNITCHLKENYQGDMWIYWRCTVCAGKIVCAIEADGIVQSCITLSKGGHLSVYSENIYWLSVYAVFSTKYL